ncbi:MAG: MarR family transcriptional regulator [Verrucomicrobiae bacterium]|nr:MarR family transcriptional regulator [Verrucomicrobiae bacterium]
MPDELPASDGVHYQALLQLLRTSEAIWSASRQFFEPWGLTPAQFNLLNLLSETGDGLTQSDLSRELLTHRSNITGLVDRLEARGLVQRREQSGDRRAWRVVLTPDGRRQMHTLLPAYYRAAARLWDGISEQRAAKAADVLRAIAANAEAGAARVAEGSR